MSMIGAVLAFSSALAARVTRSPGLEWAHAKRLEAERDRLAYERDQIRNYADLLERELATQRSMADHWLRELQQTIRERPLPPLPYISSAAQMQAMQQIAFNSQFDGFCNCVPGRSQLFAVHHSLVNALNQT